MRTSIMIDFETGDIFYFIVVILKIKKIIVQTKKRKTRHISMFYRQRHLSIYLFINSSIHHFINQPNYQKMVITYI